MLPMLAGRGHSNTGSGLSTKAQTGVIVIITTSNTTVHQLNNRVNEWVVSMAYPLNRAFCLASVPMVKRGVALHRRWDFLSKAFLFPSKFSRIPVTKHYNDRVATIIGHHIMRRSTRGSRSVC